MCSAYTSIWSYSGIYFIYQTLQPCPSKGFLRLLKCNHWSKPTKIVVLNNGLLLLIIGSISNKTFFVKSTIKARFGYQTSHVCGLQAWVLNVGQFWLTQFLDLCGWYFDDHFDQWLGHSYQSDEVVLATSIDSPINYVLHGDWILYSKMELVNLMLSWLNISFRLTDETGLSLGMLNIVLVFIV